MNGRIMLPFVILIGLSSSAHAADQESSKIELARKSMNDMNEVKSIFKPLDESIIAIESSQEVGLDDSATSHQFKMDDIQAGSTSLKGLYDNHIRTIVKTELEVIDAGAVTTPTPEVESDCRVSPSGNSASFYNTDGSRAFSYSKSGYTLKTSSYKIENPGASQTKKYMVIPSRTLKKGQTLYFQAASSTGQKMGGARYTVYYYKTTCGSKGELSPITYYKSSSGRGVITISYSIN